MTGISPVSAPQTPIKPDQTACLFGPVLILNSVENERLSLSALFLSLKSESDPNAPAPIETPDGSFSPSPIAEYSQHILWRACFPLPADRASYYQWNGTRYDITSDFGRGFGRDFNGDLRIAYVSCNGEEHGDLDRAGPERNKMWARLCKDHQKAPFSLILHGGDQVYADEVTDGHPLSQDWPEKLPRDPSQADQATLRQHLREGFLQRYLAIYRAPEFAWIAARVPSMMQWDDHDICDGWGSLRRSRTYSPTGQILFQVAHEAALLFQHGCGTKKLSDRFSDPDGGHLGWKVELPGLRILAPDLRSERTRREIMGELGWQMMEAEAAKPSPGRTLLMSSVPLLGPRLSLLEMAMVLTPRMQKYEDDLRDQWQSRAHRGSWKRMLGLVKQIAAPKDQQITALSGEIHLATRGEMTLERGELLHQLVASGIAHRAPPRAWAKILGTLAALGESPLPGHPIRIRRIPGQIWRYAAERNYLVLHRRANEWSANWEFERSGTSPDLKL
ncbi:hypothetical protein RSK20926_16837 [Roseobacter sp. SK209-2-6]|uniref:alkaline phosphatase D family protein n=1 Tax=Roseobacter sp. SK209-2-6 TaxID=388739 RepID=UPI0000F3BFFF|nr:alkaline phosphatase D family protein [Roseobacter sp. SK209-2-6]EBA14882.1 hypothetical protein RSK20926_16837 [Roseobacter sp. SK209-2-6]